MEEYRNPEEEQSNLFEDQDHIQFIVADRGQRFLNWLLDNLLIGTIVSYITWQWCVEILYQLAPDFTTAALSEESSQQIFLTYLVNAVHVIFYYTVCEKAFKGQTLAKLLTGTRAIRKDGKELSVKDALLRSLTRIVPFEVFSGIANELWHDRWTKTTVIKRK